MANRWLETSFLQYWVYSCKIFAKQKNYLQMCQCRRISKVKQTKECKRESTFWTFDLVEGGSAIYTHIKLLSCSNLTIKNGPQLAKNSEANSNGQFRSQTTLPTSCVCIILAIHTANGFRMILHGFTENAHLYQQTTASKLNFLWNLYWMWKFPSNWRKSNL